MPYLLVYNKMYQFNIVEKTIKGNEKTKGQKPNQTKPEKTKQNKRIADKIYRSR